jgi:hypothetical protein
MKDNGIIPFMIFSDEEQKSNNHDLKYGYSKRGKSHHYERFHIIIDYFLPQ